MAPRGKRRAVRPRAPSVVPRWYAALGLVALATAAFGIVHGRDVADATSTPTVVHHVRSPLTINGTAALAPDPADEQPQLSAEAAWSRYEQQTGGSRPTVPVGTTVYLGLFTQASVVDRLSYVFRLPTSLGCTAVHPTASPDADGSGVTDRAVPDLGRRRCEHRSSGRRGAGDPGPDVVTRSSPDGEQGVTGRFTERDRRYLLIRTNPDEGAAMTERETSRVSKAELAAEGATPLPDKEVLSLLDLNADLDLALDAAAPIDLALGANANIAAPIDAAVSANVLSFDSSSAAAADQGAMITQGIVGDANAEALQDSGIDQGSDLAGTGDTAGTADATALPTDGVTSTDPSTVDGALSGDLLDVNVDLNANADLAAPIDGAVAANANVAAPIDAAVSANIGSVGSDSIAVADQNVIIDQSIDGDANATADQVSDITQ